MAPPSNPEIYHRGKPCVFYAALQGPLQKKVRTDPIGQQLTQKVIQAAVVLEWQHYGRFGAASLSPRREQALLVQ